MVQFLSHCLSLAVRNSQLESSSDRPTPGRSVVEPSAGRSPLCSKGQPLHRLHRSSVLSWDHGSQRSDSTHEAEPLQPSGRGGPRPGTPPISPPQTCAAHGTMPTHGQEVFPPNLMDTVQTRVIQLPYGTCHGWPSQILLEIESGCLQSVPADPSAKGRDGGYGLAGITCLSRQIVRCLSRNTCHLRITWKRHACLAFVLRNCLIHLLSLSSDEASGWPSERWLAASEASGTSALAARLGQRSSQGARHVPFAPRRWAHEKRSPGKEGACFEEGNTWSRLCPFICEQRIPFQGCFDEFLFDCRTVFNCSSQKTVRAWHLAFAGVRAKRTGAARLLPPGGGLRSELGRTMLGGAERTQHTISEWLKRYPDASPKLRIWWKHPSSTDQG